MLYFVGRRSSQVTQLSSDEPPQSKRSQQRPPRPQVSSTPSALSTPSLSSLFHKESKALAIAPPPAVEDVRTAGIAVHDQDGRIRLDVAEEEEIDLDALRRRSRSTLDEDEDLKLEKAHNPPVLNVCIMIVGTRGDVQPFLAIAQRLQQDGHRVRLATHAIYEDIDMLEGEAEVSDKRNYLSYKLVDLLMWQGTEGIVNEFRTQVLGLRKIRKGDGGRDILLDLKIPHAFMWSPELVPKPKDWGDLYDVVGTVVLEGTASTYTPSPELEAFLGNDGGPILNDLEAELLEEKEATTKMIIDAAKQLNERVLIQSRGSDMAGDRLTPDDISFIG
ncbi:Sterol 3-beta-glucosyltransferase, partial [Phytophthora palmivora]